MVARWWLRVCPLPVAPVLTVSLAPCWCCARADVTQDDEWFAPLTVRETLTYAAQLKLPVSLTSAERTARVDEILSDLDLTEVRALCALRLSERAA